MRRFLVFVAAALLLVVLVSCNKSELSRGPLALRPAAQPTPAQAPADRSTAASAEAKAPSREPATEPTAFGYAAADGSAEPGRAARAPGESAARAASGPETVPPLALQVAGEVSADAPRASGATPERPRPERKLAWRDPGPEPRRMRNLQIQSGTLTAGSFDDNERFDDYRQFVSEAMQGDAAEQLPRLAIGARVMIQVTDSQGAPVGDARVVVRGRDAGQQVSAGDDPEGPALVELFTGSDGRTMFLTEAGGGSDREFLVTVRPPDGAEPVQQVMHVDQGPWRITLPATRSERPNKLDLALVIDTTGSMGDELEYLKVEIDSIARSVYQMFPEVGQRYALVVYRDQGDQYVTRTFDFTGSIAEFRATLAEQSASGGGDYPESMHLALESAGQLDWRERQTARVLFLVADAPPHDRFAQRTLEAVEKLRQRGVRVFPVAASGAAAKAEFVLRAAGFLTLGQYLFLTDHSGVGNPHAQPHVPEYQVERLDRLMIRMIASELSGRKLAADEVLAIERGDGALPRPDQGPVDPEQQSNARARSVDRRPIALGELPRWLLLAAAAIGLCVVDSLVTRGQR